MGLLNAPHARCSAGGVIGVLVRCSSRILIALLLSRKRCAIHAGGCDASQRLPPTRNVHKYHSFFIYHPTDNPRRYAMCTSERRHLPGCYETRYQRLGTMGQDVQPVPLASSYSSLQGADSYSGESVIAGPHGEVTKGSIFITHPSHIHAVSRRMPWKGGANMREKSLALGQRHCLEVSSMQGEVSSGAIRQRKKATLSPSVLLLPGSIPPVFSSSSSQRGSACALVSGTRAS
jgi:hypothetical protein